MVTTKQVWKQQQANFALSRCEAETVVDEGKGRSKKTRETWGGGGGREEKKKEWHNRREMGTRAKLTSASRRSSQLPRTKTNLHKDDSLNNVPLVRI